MDGRPTGSVIAGYKEIDGKEIFMSSWNLFEEDFCDLMEHMGFSITTFDTELLKHYKDIFVYSFVSRQLLVLWGSTHVRDGNIVESMGKRDLTEIAKTIDGQIDTFIDESDENFKKLVVNGASHEMKIDNEINASNYMQYVKEEKK